MFVQERRGWEGVGDGVREGVGESEGVAEGVSVGVVEGVVGGRGKGAEAAKVGPCEGEEDSVCIAVKMVVVDALEERMGENEELAEGASTKVVAAVAVEFKDAALAALEKGLEESKALGVTANAGDSVGSEAESVGESEAGGDKDGVALGVLAVAGESEGCSEGEGEGEEDRVGRGAPEEVSEGVEVDEKEGGALIVAAAMATLEAGLKVAVGGKETLDIDDREKLTMPLSDGGYAMLVVDGLLETVAEGSGLTDTVALLLADHKIEAVQDAKNVALLVEKREPDTLPERIQVGEGESVIMAEAECEIDPVAVPVDKAVKRELLAHAVRDKLTVILADCDRDCVRDKVCVAVAQYVEVGLAEELCETLTKLEMPVETVADPLDDWHVVIDCDPAPRIINKERRERRFVMARN